VERLDASGRASRRRVSVVARGEIFLAWVLRAVLADVDAFFDDTQRDVAAAVANLPTANKAGDAFLIGLIGATVTIQPAKRDVGHC
jgi:hypothetical protein